MIRISDSMMIIRLLREWTHWRRVTHIFVSKLAIAGSGNGSSPDQCQTIIGAMGTKFSEIVIEIYTFLFKNMHFKKSSGKWRTSCFGLSVLILLSIVSSCVLCRGKYLPKSLYRNVFWRSMSGIIITFLFIWFKKSLFCYNVVLNLVIPIFVSEASILCEVSRHYILMLLISDK